MDRSVRVKDKYSSALGRADDQLLYHFHQLSVRRLQLFQLLLGVVELGQDSVVR